jgi:hypothetical protein
MAFAKAVRSGFRRGGTIRNSTCLPRLLLIQLYIIAASHRSLTTRITGKFNRLDCYVQTIMKSPGALAGFFWSVVIIAPRDDYLRASEALTAVRERFAWAIITRSDDDYTEEPWFFPEWGLGRGVSCGNAVLEKGLKTCQNLTGIGV